MTRSEARVLSTYIANYCKGLGQKVKAVHVMPHLHGGHLTIRLFAVNQTAPDPDPYVFTVEELT